MLIRICAALLDSARIGLVVLCFFSSVDYDSSIRTYVIERKFHYKVVCLQPCFAHSFFSGYFPSTLWNGAKDLMCVPLKIHMSKLIQLPSMMILEVDL